MTQEEYWYCLTNQPMISNEDIRRLLSRFSSPDEFFHADCKTMVAKGGIKEAQASSLLAAFASGTAERELDRLKDKGIQFVWPGHPEYPCRFDVLEDKPYSVYYKGRLPDPCGYTVGMVGARACTDYGKEMARRFANAFAVCGIPVISGLAAGIDACSSESAIASGGTSFCVMGTGVDIIYPKENTDLYYRILMTGGGILSEFSPGTKGLPWHFPHRNRLISALSDKLLILEARKRSGTLTTAQHALSQGIDICALPGKITDPVSEGCNRLIADGCGILLDPASVIEELLSHPVRCLPAGCRGRQYPGKAGPAESLASKELVFSGSRAAAELLGLLDASPKQAECLARLAGFSVVETNAALAELQIYGFAAETSRNQFVRIYY